MERKILKKTMLSVVLFAAFLFAESTPTIWDGTADVSWYEGDAQTYNLTTAEQLAGLAKLVNDSTSSFEGKTITLGADIFLNDTTGSTDIDTWAESSLHAWIPIGTRTNPFKGEFDGRGDGKNHVIYGIYIKTPKSNYQGLFGNVANANVKNLDVIVGYIHSNEYVGALIGNATNTTITNVSSRVKVNGCYNVGGVVGYLNGKINNSYAEGDVLGESIVGGLVGYASSDNLSDTTYRGFKYVVLLVKNSYSLGKVSGKINVGGLVGYGNGDVDSSYHTNGDVLGESTVGGLVGSLYFSSDSRSHIYDSYVAECSVSGSGSSVGGIAGEAHYLQGTHFVGKKVKGDSYVGGLVGLANAEEGRIYDSYVAADSVSGSGDYVGGIAGKARYLQGTHFVGEKVEGVNYVGGLVGFGNSFNALIYDSYVAADSVSGSGDYVGGIAGDAYHLEKTHFVGKKVKGVNYVGGLGGHVEKKVVKSYAKGNVEGKKYVGGLMGEVDEPYPNNTDTVRCEVSQSFSLADVRGVTIVGGLVGSSNKFTISKSYAGGSISFIADSSLNEEIYGGGLVGFASGLGDDANILLEEVYSKVNVEISSKETSGCMIGAATGRQVVKRSYYDVSICDTLDMTGTGSAEHVENNAYVQKTTEEMQSKDSYDEWDFTNTWTIYKKTYPLLKFVTKSFTNAVITIDSQENLIYDGTAKKPRVSVELFGETLNLKNDYSISYKNNVNVGTASISVCELGSDTASNSVCELESDTASISVCEHKSDTACKSVNFEITKAEINPTISVVEPVIYNGEEQKPAVNVFNGQSLLKASDYSVAYSENKNAGVASVTVTMKGNYSGTGTANFTIEKAAAAVIEIPTASDVVDTVVISTSILTGGSSNIEGEFIWKDSTAIASADVAKYAVVFVPVDTANYKNSEDVMVPVNVIKILNIVFADYDKTQIQKIKVAYGTVPSYTGKDPVRASTAQYDYTFAGWTPEIVSVTDTATYTAVYDSTLRSYTVVFKIGDETVQSSEVAYGEVPAYEGKKPTKASTAQYDYTFAGWTPEIVSVIGTVTYTAVYDSTLRMYTVAFKNGSETVQTSAVAYGEVPAYEGKKPTKASTAQYDYTFAGWTPEIVSVTDTATYTAVYDSTLRSYTVAFKNGSETVQTSEVAYGEVPAYEGKKPAKASTAKYDYTFAGWTPEIVSVTDTATYTAVYDSTLRSYTVVFKIGDETVQSSEVAYGEVPAYEGKKPTKASTAKYDYTFAGWTPKIDSVIGAVTYTAVYDSTLRSYTVVFKIGDETVQSSEVAYGEVPAYEGKKPTKASTSQYDYTFAGWTPKIDSVIGAQIYIAEFDSTKTEKASIFVSSVAPRYSVEVMGRTLKVLGVNNNVSNHYVLMDMQGRLIKRGAISENFTIEVPHTGSFLLCIGKSKSRVNVK